MTGKSAVICWDALPNGVEHVKSYRSQGYDLVRCNHAHRRLNDFGVEMCLLCKGDEFTTSGFRKAVLMFVKLAKGALDRQTQAALF